MEAKQPPLHPRQFPGRDKDMSEVFATIKVEFDGRTVEADMILTGGGLTSDWQARSEEDKDWLDGLIGLNRTISRAMDAENGTGEYKGITVTMSEA
jgi:hypothetical protein